MLLDILPVRVIYLTDMLALIVLAKVSVITFVSTLFCPDLSSLRSWGWNVSALYIYDNIGGSIIYRMSKEGK